MMIKKLRTRPFLRAIVLICAVCLLLFSLWQAVGRYLWISWRARQTQEDAKSLYYSRTHFELLDALLPSAFAEETQLEIPELQPDFQALYEANPDTVGWLKAGADIDYPVVQSDNAFYLDHDFYGNADINGTLFLNEFNALIPRDDVLLIHGHHMRSGAMFGKLMDYEDYEYVCQYPIITFRTIYDPEDVFYVPVFAFNASMDPNSDDFFDIARLNFENDSLEQDAPDASCEEARHSAAFEEYLTQLADKSLWQSPADVNVNDRLLILITCSYYHDNGRFMLICRQLRTDETPENIVQLFG